MKKPLQHLNSLIKKHPGYSQIPNFIYSLGLSKHALLVLLYLIRCANRLKDNICFPSIKTTSKNCSIPSETTVRAAIQELHDRGIITKKTLGRKNIYKICEHVYLAIDKANGKECNISDLEDIPPYSDGIENEETENSTVDTHSDGTPPLDDEIPTHSGVERQHIVTPNKTKGTKLKNNTNKQEEQNSENTNFERVSIDSKVSTTGKTTSLAEANEYYQSLTESDKISFNIAASDLALPGEATPGGKIQMLRTARLRFYELLKQEPKRLDGFEHYNVPPDEMEPASEPWER